MEPEQAIAELIELTQLQDTEEAHISADDVLCQLLINLGHEEVVRAFHQVRKWYA